MSTPCQIMICENKEKAENNDWDVLLYVHHDGYPEDKGDGMLNPLVEFIQWFVKYHREWNTGRIGARLIQHLTNAYDKHMEDIYTYLSSIDEEAYHQLKQINRTLSFEISKGINMGIKWLYKIYPAYMEVHKVEIVHNAPVITQEFTVCTREESKDEM